MHFGSGYSSYDYPPFHPQRPKSNWRTELRQDKVGRGEISFYNQKTFDEINIRFHDSIQPLCIVTYKQREHQETGTTYDAETIFALASRCQAGRLPVQIKQWNYILGDTYLPIIESKRVNGAEVEYRTIRDPDQSSLGKNRAELDFKSTDKSIMDRFFVILDEAANLGDEILVQINTYLNKKLKLKEEKEQRQLSATRAELPLSELSSIKKLIKLTKYDFKFKEEKLDGKKTAVIYIEKCNTEYVSIKVILDYILLSYEEFKQFHEIKIIGNSALDIRDEAYIYLYDFIKKTPDFKIKVYLATSSSINFTDFSSLKFGGNYNFNMLANFLIEQRLVWDHLSILIKEPYPTMAYLNIFFKKSTTTYPSIMLEELEFKNRNRKLATHGDTVFMFKLHIPEKIKDSFPNFSACLFRFFPATDDKNLIFFIEEKAVSIYSIYLNKIITTSIIGKSLDDILSGTVSEENYIFSLKNQTILPIDTVKKLAIKESINLEKKQIQEKILSVKKEIEKLQPYLTFLGGLGYLFGETQADSKKFTQTFPMKEGLAVQFLEEMQADFVKKHCGQFKGSTAILSLREQVGNKQDEEQKLTNALINLCLREEKEFPSEDKSELHSQIIKQFIQLGSLEEFKEKIKISDDLNIIGETLIILPPDTSSTETEKLNIKIKELGLKRKIYSNNSLIIEMKSDELEKWLQDKITHNQKISLRKEEAVLTSEKLSTSEPTKKLDEAKPEFDKISTKSQTEFTPSSPLQQQSMLSSKKKNLKNIPSLRPESMVTNNLC